MWILILGFFVVDGSGNGGIFCVSEFENFDKNDEGECSVLF